MVRAPGGSGGFDRGARRRALGLVSVREKQGEEEEGRLEAKGREGGSRVFVSRGVLISERIKKFLRNAPSSVLAFISFFLPFHCFSFLLLFLLSIFLHALDTGFAPFFVLLCLFILYLIYPGQPIMRSAVVGTLDLLRRLIMAMDVVGAFNFQFSPSLLACCFIRYMSCLLHKRDVCRCLMILWFTISRTNHLLMKRINYIM
jgi:hypothetical protein